MQSTSHIQRNAQTSLDLRIQLWDTAFTSDTEMLEHFQSKALCMTVVIPLFVLNTVV
jgi:hypothetical protein